MSHEDKELYEKAPIAKELIQAGRLLDFYVLNYKKRYSTEPIFSLDNAHLTTIKDIQKIARHKAFDIVRHYLCMNDDWFLKNGHSLECLKKSINVVNADFGKKSGSTVGSRGKMDIHWSCDQCFNRSWITISINHDWSKLTLCNNCLKA